MHWVQTYPHEIYASVLLFENKIVDWKIGQHRFSQTIIPKNGAEIKEKCFIVNTPNEHDSIFEIDAPRWIEQWEYNERYITRKASEPTHKPGDIITLVPATNNWVPAKYKIYYFADITSPDLVGREQWEDDYIDNFRLNLDLVRKTEEDAKVRAREIIETISGGCDDRIKLF